MFFKSYYKSQRLLDDQFPDVMRNVNYEVRKKMAKNKAFEIFSSMQIQTQDSQDFHKVYNKMGICYKFKTAGVSIKKYLLSTELGFKIYIILSLALLIVTQLAPEVHQILLFTPVLVIEKYQYWRLFSSFLTNGKLQFVTILFLLLNFCFLSFALRRIQTKYSTVYLISEIFKQNFIINLLLTIIFYPLIAVGLIQDVSIIKTWGTLVVSVNFVCQLASRSMQEQFNLIYIPLKLKYLPWILLITLIGFQANQMPTFVSIFVICMFQHYFLSKPLLAFPLAFYQGIDRLLPGFILQMRGYIKVSHVTQLNGICRAWCKSEERRKKNVSDNSRFQQHWKEKQFDPPAQSQKTKQNYPAAKPIDKQLQNRGKQANETEIKCDTSQSEVFESKLIDYKAHWKSKYADQDDGVHPIASHQIFNENIAQASTHNRDEEADENFNNFVHSEDRSFNSDGPQYKTSGPQNQIFNDRQLQPQGQQQQQQKKSINASKEIVKYSPAVEQQQWY